MRRKSWLLVVLAVVVATALLASRSSTEAAVRAPLEAVVRAAQARSGEPPAARADRLVAALLAAVATDARIRADDLAEIGPERAALLHAARAHVAALPAVSLDDTQVRIAPDARHATLLATLLLSSSGQSEPIRRTRKLLLTLERRSDAWTIVTIELPMAPRDEPEARP